MSENSIVVLQNATKLLAEVKDAKDAKKLMDIAHAAEHYAKKAKLGQEVIDYAHAIKIEAQSLLGKYLVPPENKNKGGNPILTPTRKAGVDKPTLKQLGLSYKESVLSQFLSELAKNSPEEFEAIKEGVRTVSEVKRQHNIKKKQESFVPTEIPQGEFNIILADPPWKYDFSSTSSRKIENQYPTMELEDMCKLNIPSSEKCLLLLWATAPKLKEALHLMESWGFTYKTNAVWIKDMIGMGYYFRSQHELLLVGNKGDMSPPFPNQRSSSVIHAPRIEHSKKPKEIYAVIESMYPNHKYLELFSREERTNWTTWINN